MKGIALCLSPEKAHRRTSHNLATHRLNRKVVSCFDWAAKDASRSMRHNANW
jgi:hypothetical protein